MEQSMTASQETKKEPPSLTDELRFLTKTYDEAYAAMKTSKAVELLASLIIFGDKALTKGATESLFNETVMKRYEDKFLYPTSSVIWLTQAHLLFQKGFAEDLSLGAYLTLIPEIRADLLEEDKRFEHLVLVDKRHGLVKSCQLAGLRYYGNDNAFEDFDPKKVRVEEVYWMRCQDGRRNRGRSAQDCRKSFAKGETGLIAHEGVAFYIQRPKIIEGHFVDLSDSVSAGRPDRIPSLGSWSLGPELHWGWIRGESAGNGSGSRRGSDP
jgi:hypothetical protein